MADVSEIQSIIDEGQKRVARLHESLGIEGKKSRIAEIEKAMESPDFWNDKESAQSMAEELSSLKGDVEPVVEIDGQLRDSAELLEMAREMEEPAEIDNVAKDIQGIPARLDKLELMALLSGPHDREPCFFSIHTGAGGSDACEWAEMLLRMYTRYFDRKGWKWEELSLVTGEEAGIKGVDLRVSGPYAYGYLRGEMGVHRLVRISPFSGRRETSFAAVDVVPDYQSDIDIEIDENDLRIDRIHATGKGGQHVNKASSAVRITHEPSGIVVLVQAERSQHRNKDMAMKILKSRLQQKAESEREAAESARNAAKSDNAWGSQIRNYVLHPYTLVKDTRTTHETGDTQRILDGDIDGFADAYLRWAVQGR